MTEAAQTQNGSSPRLRGTWAPTRRIDCVGRFIPAPAGNIQSLTPCASCASVHPRACGEHPQSVSAYFFRDGSSPRLRGTCRHQHLPVHTPRFIPAPAGNIGRSGQQRGGSPVHPRACGEHAPGRRRSALIVGSSPRLRGTSLVSAGILNSDRFIPAPAGNITAHKHPSAFNPVHPRACGEHRVPPFFEPLNDGSSPRLRGT